MTLDAGGLGRSPWPLRTGLTDNYGLIWTAGILLRIKRPVNRPEFRAYFLTWEGWHVHAGQV
jgi:hypothetical protein